MFTLTSPVPAISKSKFLAGLQCPKRQYLQVWYPELAAEAAMGIKEQGTLVGVAARDAFSGGVLVDIPSHNDTFDKAVAETERIMSDPNVRYIFEGAFMADGVRVRVDVLIRKSSGWLLGCAPVNKDEDYLLVDEIVGEVKASTKVKEHHIWDASLQAFVLRKCGVNVTDVVVIHLNRRGVNTKITGDVAAHVSADTYIRLGEDGYKWDGAMNDNGTRKYNFAELFVPVPITVLSDSLIEAELKKQHHFLGQPSEPRIACGGQCTKPYECEFTEHCHNGLPIDDLAYMPNVLGSTKWNQIDGLRNSGVASICDIDSNLFLKTKSKIDRVQDAHKRGSVVADRPKLGGWMDKLKFPVNFLDYETVAFALPNVRDTKPWDAIPMQLSNHRLDVDGTLTHQEFLAEADGTDPRILFIKALLAAVGTEGSIVTYTMYEFNNVNEPLAEQYPQYAERLRALKARAWDMCKVVNDCVYHPEFRGSFSIKAVLPVLVPDMGYEHLAISNGMDVLPVWNRLLNDKSMTTAERQRVRADLLTYCGQDTMGMVRLMEVLNGLANDNTPGPAKPEFPIDGGLPAPKSSTHVEKSHVTITDDDIPEIIGGTYVENQNWTPKVIKHDPCVWSEKAIRLGRRRRQMDQRQMDNAHLADEAIRLAKAVLRDSADAKSIAEAIVDDLALTDPKPADIRRYLSNFPTQKPVKQVKKSVTVTSPLTAVRTDSADTSVLRYDTDGKLMERNGRLL